MNLVSNAVKFAERGGVEVALRCERDGGRGVLSSAVSDTGIRIPEEQMPRLFQPFTQAGFSTTREYEGTGLGLSICRRPARGAASVTFRRHGRAAGGHQAGGIMRRNWPPR